MSDMKIRIRYLKAHDFSIARIIKKNSSWFTWTIKSTDERFGYFQNKFRLSEAKVQYLAINGQNLLLVVRK